MQREAMALQGTERRCYAKEMQFGETQRPGIELTRYGMTEQHVAKALRSIETQGHSSD